MFEQLYDRYTSADHKVWSMLYARQIGAIENTSYQQFKKGLEDLGFSPTAIPNFSTINERLRRLTGWDVQAVPGLIPGKEFFTLMAAKHFVSTTWIRKMEQLDYLEEPDMFHDTFGHIPLLADPIICEYLSKLAQIAAPYLNNEQVIELIGRLYWFTVEFGLVKEHGQLKIYGAGILSSPGETEFCLSPKATRLPFNLEKVLSTPYPIDRFQEQYFVIEKMEDLPAIADQLADWLVINKNKIGLFIQPNAAA